MVAEQLVVTGRLAQPINSAHTLQDYCTKILQRFRFYPISQNWNLKEVMANFFKKLYPFNFNRFQEDLFIISFFLFWKGAGGKFNFLNLKRLKYSETFDHKK